MTSPPSTAAADPTPAELDQWLLGCMTDEWCKVAMIIAKATDAARAAGRDVVFQTLAQRIYALAETGRIETRGNIRRWRAAEVRALTA